MRRLLLSLAGNEGVAFRAEFSRQDVHMLKLPRRGHSFDLENFKAYLDGDGFISLAMKPDYLVHVTLRYSELQRQLVDMNSVSTCPSRLTGLVSKVHIGAMGTFAALCKRCADRTRT